MSYNQPPTFVRDEALRCAFSDQLSNSLAIRQGVGLGEEIRHELVMVGHSFPRQIDRVGGFAKANKLCRHNSTL